MHFEILDHCNADTRNGPFHDDVEHVALDFYQLDVQRIGNFHKDRLDDLRPIAFFPFWSQPDYSTTFISDDSRSQKTITLYPSEENPYILLVLTFDKEKMVPAIIKFYSGEMNNMVRLETQSDYKMVGARPLPQKIAVNNYEDNTKTDYAIEWTLLESLPEALLDEATFHTASLDQ